MAYGFSPSLKRVDFVDRQLERPRQSFERHYRERDSAQVHNSQQQPTRPRRDLTDQYVICLGNHLPRLTLVNRLPAPADPLVGPGDDVDGLDEARRVGQVLPMEREQGPAAELVRAAEEDAERVRG